MAATPPSLHDRYARARAIVRERPVLWTMVLITSIGAAVVIWFAMQTLDVTVKVPIILVAALLNVIIAAGYAADFRERDHEA